MKKLIIIPVIFGAFTIFLIKDPALAQSNTKLRLVSLAPSITEILFALYLDDEIVGVSSFCNYPPEKVKNKEKVGSFNQPNIEKIIALNPDIVFCAGLDQNPVIKQLRQLNLNVYASDPANMKELFDSILKIGKLTGREEEAQTLIDKMQGKIERTTSRVKFIPTENRPTVFIEYWNNPLMTAGPGSLIDDLISVSGGMNIAYDTKRPYSYFSPEQLIESNPQCIILLYIVNEEAAKKIKERVGWQNISAIKNNRIYYDIDQDLILRPGPRIAEGVLQIHKRLYPSEYE